MKYFLIEVIRNFEDRIKFEIMLEYQYPLQKQFCENMEFQIVLKNNLRTIKAQIFWSFWGKEKVVYSI